MNCMKCGRELKDDAVFCPDCLEEMVKYPVRPETAVHIPQQPKDHLFRRQHRKAVMTQDEIIHKLKKKLRNLRIVAVVLAVLVLLLATAVATAVYELDVHKIWGTNYTIVDADGNAIEQNSQAQQDD